MTQSPTDPPNNYDQASDQLETGSSLQPLTSDEKVALFVAFLSLGGILLWGLTRSEINLFNGSTQSATNSGLINSALAIDDLADSETSLDRISGETITGASDSAQAALAQKIIASNGSLANRGSVWRDMSVSAAGAAAGVTGAAVTAERTLAGEEPDTTELNVIETDTEEKDVDSTSESAMPEETNDSDVVIVPSEAARAKPKEAINFQDVPDGHWAKTYIDALSSRGLISGYENGTFKPDEPVTRAQVADVVSRIFDLTADKENLEFTDVESDNWARESIGEVVKGGFMTGFPDDTFKPNIPVTRTQALATLVTGLEIEPPGDIQAALDLYSDIGEIPDWATEKMAAATESGFVVNYPDVSKLNPTGSTTRAELSAMIYQALVREGIVEPVETEYVVNPQ